MGDTQLYTEATPWTMTEQFEYIRDSAEARKTAMVIQAGDWVNREEYEDEWQWKSAEPSAKILEQAGLPFAISWGNHDYNERYNGRQLLPKYFPMERFAGSLEGSPWTFGGSNDIDNYYYTGEIANAKILWLQLGYWSAERDDHPGIAWAKSVIEAHPEYTVILSTHHHLWARDVEAPYSNPRVNTLLVDPYPNVKLVLSGHQSGTFVSSRVNDHGVRTYGILTDYQTRAWGGHGYLKNLSVDAENGLIYVNTYSPWLQRTTSEGRWSQPIPLTEAEGYHGENSENYVIELDLGGSQTRTLDTARITFAAGARRRSGTDRPRRRRARLGRVLPGARCGPGVVRGAHRHFGELDGVEEQRHPARGLARHRLRSRRRHAGRAVEPRRLLLR
ncbi:metallophosphoesterase [Leucobacter soli]|uniref:metallophosphoesterase n=1 Tax=Leucobacter soli TaxID=2812850 RepID=UPI0036155002